MSTLISLVSPVSVSRGLSASQLDRLHSCNTSMIYHLIYSGCLYIVTLELMLNSRKTKLQYFFLKE